VDWTKNNGVCCGCGVCVALCPKHTITMQWNEYGEYNPVQLRDCGKECGLCLKVCPFIDGNPNEDEIGSKLFSEIPGIQHNPVTGYYLSSGVGGVASEEKRWHSASGGLTTWLLQKLLSEHLVDAVLCVTSTENSDALFAFRVATTDEDIYAAAGSAYYPVEMSQVISHVLEYPGRYAVVGLPCFLKALRLAQSKNGILQKRLVFFIGLTCGHLTSKYLAKCAAELSGLDETPIYIRYRNKSPERPAHSHCFLLRGEYGSTKNLEWDKSLFGLMWGNQFLGLTSCMCCDDIVAECADVTFMDAWLPAYSSNPIGTNLWISRSPEITMILEGGKNDGTLSIAPISIEKVIQSLSPRTKKRTTLSYRLHLMRKMNLSIPTKRTFDASEPRPSLYQRYICRKQLRIQQGSRNQLKVTNGDVHSLIAWFKKEAKDPIYTIALRHLGAVRKYAGRKISSWAPRRE
jgi:coenzyme F420 hydrogenase subunit beta